MWRDVLKPTIKTLCSVTIAAGLSLYCVGHSFVAFSQARKPVSQNSTGPSPKSLSDSSGGVGNPAAKSASPTNDISEESVSEDVSATRILETIMEPPVEYSYASFGKNDPFVPPESKAQKLKSKGQEDAERKAAEKPLLSPLQAYELRALRPIGIWRLIGGEFKALILTPVGEGIVTKLNDPIGNRNGKIIDIRSKAVTVREFTTAPDGTRQFQDVEIPISNSPADRQPPEKRRDNVADKSAPAGLKQDASGSQAPAIAVPPSVFAAPAPAQPAAPKTPETQPSQPAKSTNGNSQLQRIPMESLTPLN